MGALIDGRELGKDITTDVCVIGAGAAGISVALELKDRAFDVTLVEAGGLALDPDYQEMYRGKQVGLKTDPLQHNRWRVFGGTTGHWGGWCRPFDPIDFERRPWVPHSGWPFDYASMLPHYERASELCQVKWDYDPKAQTREEDRDLFQSDEHFENMIFRVSPPTRFGSVYREAIEGAKNVEVLLHSSVVDFELNDAKGRVDRVKVKPVGGAPYTIRAKHFVLAIGAVETARLLLNARGQHERGLGNANDLVGRFFMQHLELRKIRWVSTSAEARGRFKRPTTDEDARMAARVTPLAQRKRELLNQHVLVGAFQDNHADGVVDALKKTYKRRRDLTAVDRALHEVVLDVDADLAGDDARTLYFADILERPEQAPNPDSRITLFDERDALGLERVAMDWRLTELDRRSMRATQQLIAQNLGARGFGRIRCWTDGFDPLDTDEYLHGGHHHMGTARMHASPSQGVVDAECRVHGVPNLWIAGSATFPTSGYSNPTLTIVAMAVRVAKDIDRLMSKG